MMIVGRWIVSVILAAMLVIAPTGLMAQEAGEAPVVEEPVAAPNPALQVRPDGTVGESGLTPEELDAMTAEISGGLRCLVCRGQSILESQVQLAQDMRALTKELLAEGNTPDEVRGYFVARYGEYVLLKPTTRGWNWIVYALPFAAVFLGAFILHGRMRRWAAAPDGLSEEDAESPDVSADTDSDADESEFSEENERWLAEAIRGD